MEQKGLKKELNVFFTRDTILKIVLILWKGIDLLTSIKYYQFSEHTHQGAENSCTTGAKVTTFSLYWY